MPFSIVRNDIARVAADAVVNAANTHLAPGGGVCGALFEAAGYADMARACEAIGHCNTGDAVVTPAFRLPAQWCIHAVGPIWRGGSHGEEEALRRCYRAVFARVVELGAHSVAFPLISAGIYGYPVAQALAVAREETAAFLAEHDEVAVTLVVFDRAVVREGSALAAKIAEYIDDAYAEHHLRARSRAAELERERAWAEDASACGAPRPARHHGAESLCAAQPLLAPSSDKGTLDEALAHLDASFSETLLALIDARGMTDAEVYHRANLSRQLFAKIRGNAAYRPAKPTAVALAFALELSLSETQDLLGRAGLTLSRASKFDVIVRFFIERGIYDVFRLNEMLFAYDQPLVGSL